MRKREGEGERGREKERERQILLVHGQFILRMSPLKNGHENHPRGSSNYTWVSSILFGQRFSTLAVC